MKLCYFSVSNYRSITDAYNIDIQNLIVLIGKNNEGKSNLIKALDLAMNILKNAKVLIKRKIVPHNFYCWSEDFPINLQNSKKLKRKFTELRLDFELKDEEIQKFFEIIGSRINKDLSIFIQFKPNDTISVTVPKRGKNTKAISNKIIEISEFICERIELQYIPAIRSETDAYDVISDMIESDLVNNEDEKYVQALDYIQQYQNRRLQEIADKIKKPLCAFMPKIKSISLSIGDKSYKRRYMSGKMLNININDGVLTSLSNKGDGVKSLATIAILSQIKTNKNRIIVVDEPENHLHPEAIHYIKNVLFELSTNNQIVISTHSPIFVNRESTYSNIIVSNGKAEQAKRIDEIRKILGVMISDNLMYSDYVIVVEGPSDKTVLTKLLQKETRLNELLISGFITIRSIGGIQNLQSEIYNLERYLCKYIVVLDGDAPAKAAAESLQKTLNITKFDFRYFLLASHKEVELEDLYDPIFYKDYLMNEYQLDIGNGRFKNKAKKWSDRLADIAALNGEDLSKEVINEIKKQLSELVQLSGANYLKTEGKDLLNNILQKISHDIDTLTSSPK